MAGNVCEMPLRVRDAYTLRPPCDDQDSVAPLTAIGTRQATVAGALCELENRRLLQRFACSNVLSERRISAIRLYQSHTRPQFR